MVYFFIYIYTDFLKRILYNKNILSFKFLLYNIDRGETMNYKITYKALDNKKAYTLQIINWWGKWYTLDDTIPELKEKQKPEKEKWYEDNAERSESPFTRGPKLSSFKVAFNKKIRERIGEDILKASYRMPTVFMVENAEYNLKDGIVWINGMTHFEERTRAYNRGSRE